MNAFTISLVAVLARRYSKNNAQWILVLISFVWGVAGILFSVGINA